MGSFSFQKRQKPIVPLIVVAVAFLVFGLIFAIGFTRAAYEQQRSAEKYVAVPGTILKTRVREVREQKQTRYQPEVTYRYHYKGKDYRSSREAYIGVFQNYVDHQEAASFLTDFPVGSPVSVYLDPEQPDQAVLFPGGADPIFAPVLFLPPLAFCLAMIGYALFERVPASSAALKAGTHGPIQRNG